MTSAPSAPSPFTAANPFLQFAWDSTSAKAAKACLRRYFYQHVCGWVTIRRRIELDFGIAAHLVFEHYHRTLVASGGDREAAISRTAAYVLARYARWTCEEDPLRSRSALLRFAVWYGDEYATDPLHTLIDPTSGAPALEHHFTLPLSERAPCGTSYLWCGHRDRVCTDGHNTYVEDLKTTTHTLGFGFFARFSPDLQMTGYDGAGREQLPGFAGIIVTAAQIAKGFLRFDREHLHRTPAHLAEWYAGLQDLLRRVETAASRTLDLYRAGWPIDALESAWPLNEESCFRCPFRSVCTEAPGLRSGLLEAQYVRRPWNPLVPRSARRLDEPGAEQ